MRINMLTSAELNRLKHFSIDLLEEVSKVKVTRTFDLDAIAKHENSFTLASNYPQRDAQGLIIEDLDYTNSTTQLYVSKDGISVYPTDFEHAEDDLRDAIKVFDKIETLENAGYSIQILIDKNSKPIDVVIAQFDGNVLTLHKDSVKVNNQVVDPNSLVAYHFRNYTFNSPLGDKIYIEWDNLELLTQLIDMHYALTLAKSV